MIAIRNVRKSFNGREVLAGVELEIQKGETHVILGRSGTGKSVLLKLICGLMRPDSGTIEFDGAPLNLDDPDHARSLLREVQMLFQGAALFDSMSISENVALHAIEHGLLRPTEAESFARPFLEMVDLPGVGAKMPSELSGGMKKRAALARALAAQPKIMLYDEPTTGLDPLTSQVINQLIRETQRRFEVTSVVVTHDLRSAQVVGDRCSFLNEGRILETTTPDRLQTSPHGMVRDFLEDALIRV